MKYVQKTWVRILVSLVVGGIAAEVIHLSTGDPNRDRGNNSNFIMFTVDWQHSWR